MVAGDGNAPWLLVDHVGPASCLAAGDYSRVMGELDSAEDYWLEGGVEAVASGAENGFLQEVDRVIDLLGASGIHLHAPATAR